MGQARLWNLMIMMAVFALAWFPLPAQEQVQDAETAKADEILLDSDQQHEFKEVAKDLRCPTCTGLSVLDSDAKFSVQIKDIVREKIKEGMSKKDILAYFTDRYGPWILRSPPKEGFNMIAWALPFALLVLGPVLVWAFVWRKRRVVSTLGVRPADRILAEMNERLRAMKSERSGG